MYQITWLIFDVNWKIISFVVDHINCLTLSVPAINYDNIIIYKQWKFIEYHWLAYYKTEIVVAEGSAYTQEKKPKTFCVWKVFFNF
jgi:hypothetical protein